VEDVLKKMERTVGEKELNGREKRGHNEDSGE
jgi:hypothetical protein